MTTQLFDRLGRPIPAFKFGTTHVVSYAGTAARMSSAVSEGVRMVLVWCSTDAHIAVGDNAVDATTNDKPITAKVDTPVVLDAGQYISAIRQATDGTMYVTELL